VIIDEKHAHPFVAAQSGRLRDVPSFGSKIGMRRLILPTRHRDAAGAEEWVKWKRCDAALLPTVPEQERPKEDSESRRGATHHDRERTECKTTRR
jgi:hypothetical protein